MQRIGDTASYARREQGGARLAWRIDGATGTETGRVKSSCHPSLLSPGEVVFAITAGRFCQRPCQADALSPAAWQTPRLPGED
ncbi:MAG: hypothetical protein WBQ19_12495, partial [Terriglobales bacterium]